jgi:hypothetical protein
MEQQLLLVVVSEIFKIIIKNISKNFGSSQWIFWWSNSTSKEIVRQFLLWNQF